MLKLASFSVAATVVAGRIMISAETQLPAQVSDATVAEHISSLSATLRFDADVPGEGNLAFLTDQVHMEVPPIHRELGFSIGVFGNGPVATARHPGNASTES